MGELFEFILSNPLILILIIGWIFATFRDKPKSQQEQQEQQKQRQGQRQPRSAQEASTSRERAEQRRRSLQEAAKEMRTEQSGAPVGRTEVEQKPIVSTNESYAEQQSVESQRLEQLEQLQHRLGAQMPSSDDVAYDVDLSAPVENDRPESLTTIKSNKPSVTSSHIRKRFNRRGLVESVIMAEVLGKPRAKRLHHRDHA